MPGIFLKPVRLKLFWKLGFAFFALLLAVLLSVGYYAERSLSADYEHSGFEQLAAIARIALSRPPENSSLLEPGSSPALRDWVGKMAAGGARVTLCGWVITYRQVGTKNYRNMMFVTLEDQRGVYEVVLFPDVYDRYGGLVFETRLMRVTGRVEPDGQIKGEKLEALRK